MLFKEIRYYIAFSDITSHEVILQFAICKWEQSCNRELYIPSTINTQINFVLLLFFGRSGCQGRAENFCNFSRNLLFKHGLAH